MTESIRFSVRVNNDLTIDDTVALALAAERAEFDQFWMSNDLFFRSAPVVLSAVAQATARIQIGTCILNPFTIDPSEIAMIAATLDELSQNRFQLGLAAGSRKFMDWVGIEHRVPLTAVRETVAIVRDLLAGKSAMISGERFRWRDGAYLRFRPSRRTPIYIGALGPKMLRLAGEIGDGVLPLLFPPEHYHTVKPLIEEAGRELDLAACVWVSLSEDAAAARRALAEKIAYYGPALTATVLERLSLTPDDFVAIDRAVTVERDMDKASKLVDERMLRIGIVGTPGDVIARLEPLVDAGARHLSFGPPLGPDPLEAVELLGRAVLPHFRG